MRKLSIAIGIFFVTALSSFTVLHEYYVSITTINLKKESKEIELTFKFIGHDLEKAISKEYGVDIKVDQKSKINDSIVHRYVQDHFNINIDSPINYLGTEFNMDESFYVYYTISYASLPSEIKVFNSFLVDTFIKQENITHFNILDKQQTFAFRLNQTQHTFTTYE